MNEDIIARWVAAEMVAEGVVTRKDGVLIVSASGRDYMIEVKAFEVTEEPQVDNRRLTESQPTPLSSVDLSERTMRILKGENNG